MDFTSFRGVDLRPRKERIRRAMYLMEPESGEDIPVIAHVPCYFGFGNEPRPQEYWTDPAVMLAFQQDGYEKHLQLVDDDTVPYFMPWFGTGVLASGFGVTLAEATGNSDDPAVVGQAVHTLEELARLRLPDPERDGWMPRVLEFMDYGVQHGEMPVGLTDMNSPLCTAAQICGYDNLFYWMYDEPDAIHDLMRMICEAFTSWVRLQRQICGEDAGQAHGLQGVYMPRGGVWMSDDDLVSVNAELYGEFVLPYYQEIFRAFQGGHLHWCGDGRHQIQNILKMDALTAVNNSPMGHFDIFQTTYKALRGKLAYEIQDAAPLDPDAYYGNLFAGLDDVRGLMVTTFVEDRLGMDASGATVYTDLDPFARANAVVQAVRRHGGAAIERGKRTSGGL